MTTTPTPAPEVEALIDFLGCVSSIPGEGDPVSAKGLAEACLPTLRSQAARIKELEAERDEAWHEYALLSTKMQRMGLDLATAEAQRDRLASRVERLRGALEPFALFDTEDWPDSMQVFEGDSTLRMGHLRTARAAYEETEDGE